MGVSQVVHLSLDPVLPARTLTLSLYLRQNNFVHVEQEGKQQCKEVREGKDCARR